MKQYIIEPNEDALFFCLFLGGGSGLMDLGRGRHIRVTLGPTKIGWAVWLGASNFGKKGVGGMGGGMRMSGMR